MTKKVQKNNAFRAGTLMACYRPVHTKITNLLVNEFNNNSQKIYSHNIYSVKDLDVEQIKKKVRVIIEKKEVDMLFTIGRTCTIAAQEVADEMGGFPLYFIAARDPEGEGIIQSLSKSGANTSGVIFEEAPTDDLANGVKAFFPEVTSLLLPYSITSKSQSIPRQALELKAILTTVGMEVFAVPIESDEKKIMSTIRKYSDRVQAILILDGCYTSIAQIEIAFNAWDKCCVYIGSNAESIDDGACASHSGSLDELAAVAFRQMRTFAEIGTPFSAMPMTVLPNNREFAVNIDALRKIGFSDEALERICTNPKIKVVRKWIYRPKSYKK